MRPYHLGQIAGIINHDHVTLTPGCLGNLSAMQGCYEVILRHVWRRASQLPAVQVLIGMPGQLQPQSSAKDQGEFWLGYHQAPEVH